MKIGVKERLVSGSGLAAIAVIAAIILWTYGEVDDANRQRQVTSAIARKLTELTLVTFDYRIYRNERTRMQWDTVSGGADVLIANARTLEPAQQEVLSRLVEGRAAGQRLFAEIKTARNAISENAALDDAGRQFESQLFSQLLALQQDNLTEVFSLGSLATDRIVDAQRRMMFAILAGLALLAAIMAGASWLLRRKVLAPIAMLQQATQQVTSGNWDVVADMHRDDEIGQLSQDFDAMTRSLREAFARVERRNHDLGALNEELRAFSYSVSHDLRGPLRSMDGFSLMLIEDYGDQLDEEGKDALARIRAASQRMGDLIDDLLRLSQVSRAELRLTEADLSAIARSIADAFAGEPSSRSVEWEIEPGLKVHADQALLRIAMQNLLQNAWKFTSKTAHAVIRVGALLRDGKQTYFVADNGAGFDMAHATNLFGAFQRLHRVEEFPGTGIGLAIVQRIIRRHEGEIFAEAKAGAGATFFFTFKEPDHGPDE